MTAEEAQAQRRSTRIRAYSTVAALASVAALGAIFWIGDTFGPPGTAAYPRYELFNRLMAVLLAVQSLGLVAFVNRNRRRISPAAYVFSWAAILAWLGMSAGTAAEFWLFTDLPFGGDNSRDAAFAFFTTSSLALLLALISLGISVLWRRRAPRWFAIGLIAYPVVDVILFAVDASLFSSPAIAALFIAISDLWGVSLE